MEKSNNSQHIDLENLKKIPIEKWLVEQGYPLHHTTNTSYFFKSPFRHEKTASFSVSKSKNRWSDFGDKKGCLLYTSDAADE